MTSEEALALATPLAVIIAAVVQQLNYAKASRDRAEVKDRLATQSEVLSIDRSEVKNRLEDVKTRVKQVHSLANSAMTAQLKISANALRRLAQQTSDPGDIADAEAAEALFHEHESKQRELDKITPKRVLLVDDDEDMTHLIEHMLKDSFFLDLVIVQSVSAAQQKLAANEHFDGAILDARLLDGNGLSFYRELTIRRPRMAVVFFTGNATHAFRREVEKIGPAPVFEKESVLRLDFLEKLLAQIGVRRNEYPEWTASEKE